MAAQTGAKKVRRPNVVVGRIAPEIDLREAPAFTGATRNIEVFDSSMRLHGCITWLAEEQDEDFNRALLDFCRIAMGQHPEGAA